MGEASSSSLPTHIGRPDGDGLDITAICSLRIPGFAGDGSASSDDEDVGEEEQFSQDTDADAGPTWEG